ncbi:PREDICTED: F-box/kelch-repeat protein At1g64840-like isoform X2 [Camelina sativa]|uniref:F-box/kelch-repeat protein At1g64840-like isoform X2 n=1 Tax=Camelina sativa TaxID=90675 RepID=A0ABM0W786_CAMSA|nr:PREDICTED: F-box/kelch-repeat protein At1g64840-like isoform X2 [Camelina sativa]
MEEPETDKKTSSMILDCSLLPELVSKLQLSPSPSAKMATKDLTLSKTDWSFLPEELLLTISTLLNNCFHVVHARSVCTSWRSAFPFPSSLLRASYSLPKLAEFTLESKDSCTLEKVPLFLFRVVKTRAAVSPTAYVMGGIGRDEDDHIELLPYPLQCSVKVNIPGSDRNLVKMLDCQILSLGHQYRMIGWDPEESSTNYRGVAFLPLNKERGGGGGGGEYVVILNYSRVLLVLRSSEMRWLWLQNVSDAPCRDLVTFRGRFYAAFFNGDVVIIDPYSLEVFIPLMPSQPMNSSNFLVPSGDDELFLVENTIPTSSSDEVDINGFICRVSKLDEEAGKWVVVSDLGDRVLFIGHFGNVCCSAKELPDGYGVSGNSILFTNEGGCVMYAYKYGLHTGRAEDDLCCWRLSSENRVAIINRSPALSLWSGC